jgi:membrane protease subunit HflK
MKKFKNALIVFAGIGLITLLKFALFYVSRSTAVLAESWYSFFQLVSVLLILFNLLAVLTTENGKHRQLILRFLDYDPELILALLSSIFMITVTATIFWHSVTAEPAVVNRSLSSGVLFLVLSLAAFFLARYLNRQEGDRSLLNALRDQIQSEAPISLAAGFTLILYSVGARFDRFIGALIAVIAFISAVEMLISVILTLVQKKRAYSHEFMITRIFRRIFRLVGAQRIVVRTVPAKKSEKQKTPVPDKRYHLGAELQSIIPRWAIAVLVVAAVVAYLFTSLYSVGVSESAIKLRFGRIVNREQPISSGLHLKLPWPIETVVRVDTERIFSMDVIPKTRDAVHIWANDQGEDIAFISGDNNFLIADIAVFYQIVDPYRYYASQSNPENLLRFISYGTLSKVFARKPFDTLALLGRIDWIKQAETDIQVTLDAMNTGIRLVDLIVKDIHPPARIVESFEQVIASYQEKQKLINTAENYYNTKIPDTRIQAFTEARQAELYAFERRKYAEGEAKNYLSNLEPYRKSKNLVRRILFLNQAQEALSETQMIIVDPKTRMSSSLIYSEKFLFEEKQQ